MIFVDTGAWYASIVVDDQHHLSARRWLDTNAQPLLTSDSIVDEALTLLKMRGHGPAAMELGRMLFAGELAGVGPGHRRGPAGSMAHLRPIRRQAMELHRLHQQGGYATAESHACLHFRSSLSAIRYGPSGALMIFFYFERGLLFRPETAGWLVAKKRKGASFQCLA